MPHHFWLITQEIIDEEAQEICIHGVTLNRATAFSGEWSPVLLQSHLLQPLNEINHSMSNA